jgi:hypothetical protein
LTARHVPTQQSPFTSHSAPIARQLPTPKSHRPTESHAPQHAPHASPVAKQGADGSAVHRPPSPASGSPEQKPLQHSAPSTQS